MLLKLVLKSPPKKALIMIVINLLFCKKNSQTVVEWIVDHGWWMLDGECLTAILWLQLCLKGKQAKCSIYFCLLCIPQEDSNFIFAQCYITFSNYFHVWTSKHSCLASRKILKVQSRILWLFFNAYFWISKPLWW